MRLRKSDPTGNYWYLCDGVSPASDVLSDGYTSFTPGLSEITGAGSRFYLPDAQGNSRGLLDGGQVNTDGYNWDGWGNLVSRIGSNPTGFAWGGGSGYQTDNDSGLKLLGHRYYDSRTGRFLSQDPAGDGDNWYAYCGNDPMDATDPEGLKELAPTDDPNVPDNWMYRPDLYQGCNAGDTFQGWTWTGSAWTQGQWSGPAGASGGDVTGPSMLSDIGSGLKVGGAAVLSAGTATGWYAPFWTFNGGAARHDPSYGVSHGLADIGVAAGTAAIPVGSLSAGARSVFYSGQGALNAARATKGAGLLLEDTIGGKVLNYIDANIYRFPGGFWKVPSAIFALNAKGAALAFLRNPTAGSVWNTVERPILKAMGTAIIPR